MTTGVGDPTIRAIIEAARSVPNRSSARVAWMTTSLSGVLYWASFPPLDWGPLAWIALVPLLLLIRPAKPLRHTILATYICGCLTDMFLVQWMRYGHVSMYAAVAALAAYGGLYYPAFVLLARTAVHRFRAPLVIAVPTIWVGLEYVRAHFGTGIAWYYLGHTQYRWIELIQVSDLTGAYGVSFVVAAAAAALAACVPDSWLRRFGILPASDCDAAIPRPVQSNTRRSVFAVAFALSLVSATVIYGYVRRAQADFVEGPRIALVQGNFTTQVKHDPAELTSIVGKHYMLTGDAVKYQPDIIIWPETMYRFPLLIEGPNLTEVDLKRVAPTIPTFAWKSGHVAQQLSDWSRQAGAALVIGIDTFAVDRTALKHYNSAAFIRPDLGMTARYDKLHRVLFGEYIPLRESLPFLRALVPFSAGFGIDAGDSAVAFDYGKWRLAPVICFEDTVPHLVRGTVERLQEGGKKVDCLVNVTNDGWFHGSCGLDQHLITALFRCVELRKPLVRAVNTGISAIVDGDGVVIEPDVYVDEDHQGRHTMRDPKTGRWHRQLNAVLVDSIPLDNRGSFYLRYGDWFAAACAFGVLLILMGGLVPRRLMGF
jgi:apolipoprotein N-acyltransferase